MNLENTLVNNTTSSLQLQIDNDLLLRDITMDDAPAIYHIVDSTRDYLRKWLPFIGYSDSVSDAEEFISSVVGKRPAQDIVFTVVYNGEVVGIAGYKNINSLNQRLELSYWVHDDYKGKGITSRTCAKLIEYAFTRLRMNRIQIKIAVNNEISKQIPRKLGFVLEGVQREGECIANKFIDMEVYSLLKRDWVKQQEEKAGLSVDGQSK